MKKCKIIYLVLSIFMLHSCGQKEVKFVFIGDIHYRIPEYLPSRYLIPRIVEDLDTMEVSPDFIIQSGDFTHGAKETLVKTEMEYAFSDFRDNMGLPFFIARGNHDLREPYVRKALPIYSEELGKEIDRTFFSFDKGNCHFIILDGTLEDLSEQLVWLDEDLQRAKKDSGIDHIFVAGHYPLWIVARPGFTRPAYSEPVAALLSSYGVDAYLCGHTHNKSITVKKIDGYPLTQIMDAAVVEEGRLFTVSPVLRNILNEPSNSYRPGLVPMEEFNSIYTQNEVEYYCGYQEGSTSTYWIFTIKGKEVKADWHVPGEKIIHSYSWNEPGKLIYQHDASGNKEIRLIDTDVDKIEEAWLYTAWWTSEDSVKIPVQINGIDAGIVKLERKKNASPLWNKKEIELKSVPFKKENEITFLNPLNRKFAVSNIFLAIRFSNGEIELSSISEEITASFGISSGYYQDFPYRDHLKSVESGQKAITETVTFSTFQK